MKIVNLKRASDFSVQNWFINSIPNLTNDQKQMIRNYDIVRSSPFVFMEKRKKVNNVFLRLSIIAIPIVYTILVTGLPFNFIINGSWGYSDKRINWFTKWMYSCGL